MKRFIFGLVMWACFGSEAYPHEVIFNPMVFDWKFYVSINSDLFRANIRNENQAKSHWEGSGIKEGRKAHPHFFVQEYCQLHEDLRKAHLCDAGKLYGAIEHYVKSGHKEGRTGLKYKQNYVGITYDTWYLTEHNWACTWGTPYLGKYVSRDERVIKYHAQISLDAGVDFMMVDWSNNIVYPLTEPNRPDLKNIEDSTTKMFEVFSQLPRYPKIMILGGSPYKSDYEGDQKRIKYKLDYIYKTYIQNSKYNKIYFHFEGKPLLLWYVGTPSMYQTTLPPFNDNRFHFRYMTGYVSEQAMVDPVTRYSYLGFTSWCDRDQQTFTVSQHLPMNSDAEYMVIEAAVRGIGGWRDPNKREGRRGGATFKTKFARARKMNVRIAMVHGLNEWVGCESNPGEQMNQEYSNDMEPMQGGHGNQYMTLLKEEIRLFKNHHH